MKGYDAGGGVCLPVIAVLISERINSTRNTTASILAIPTAAPATPENPSTAATSAMIKKVIDHPSILYSPLCV